MKKFIVLCLALICAYSASAWTRAVHAGVAAIADANLTPTAKQNIDNLLDGRTIIYYAQWLKDMGDTKGYEHTRAWRNVAMTPKGKLIIGKKAEKHSVPQINSAKAYDALVEAMTALQSAELTKEKKADHLRTIVSIIADLHCPTHYIFTDMVEKRDMVFYNSANKKHKYSLYWEKAALFGTFTWRTNELVYLLNRKTPEQVAALTNGSVTKWITGNAPIYRDVYNMLEDGTHFNKKSLREWQNKIYPIALEQVATAGYRLAAVLNGLFDPNVECVKIK